MSSPEVQRQEHLKRRRVAKLEQVCFLSHAPDIIRILILLMRIYSVGLGLRDGEARAAVGRKEERPFVV